MSFDDADLTERGMQTAAADVRPGRLLLLACGALAREILALKQANGWNHVDLTCLPAKLHNRPDQIPDAVEEAVLKHRETYDRIFVVYADCGTGGLLQQRCQALGVEMIEGPHCYAFYDGLEIFDRNAEHEITAFYLTDFLVRQFDTLIWRGMKLDRHPELRDMFFGNYTTVIYQAQTDDPALSKKAEEAADRLGLRYERRFTGYGDLARALTRASSVSG
ncbi:MAG: DUF1638 domain-containing protein [Pseudomonadota bacterium]